MAGRTSYYGGIVLDGLVFHIDSAKQESYAKRGLRYMQAGNSSMFVDFSDTSKNPSTQNAVGTIINGATFSNFAPYHLTPYYSTYWHNPVGNLDMILTDTRNTSSVWSTLEHSWDANGDTNDTKGSANGTIVTPVGETFSLSTMTYQSGKVGSGAFTFNGNNFISLPVYTLNFTSDFSASLWFYVPTGLTDSNLISSFHNKGDYTEYNGWSISYNNTTKSINFFIGIKMGAPGNPGSQYYGISLTTGNNVFVLNQWNHVLVTRKSGTRSRIYVNGVLSASDTNIYNPSYHSQPNLAYIGASYYAFSLPFYKAAPSGLKIDVVQTFTSELDSLAAGSLYSMSDLYSSSAFNNNGIGTFYGNIEFDGVDDYVSFSATPDINTTDITVSTWFYVNKFRPSAPNGGTVSMIASRYSNTTSTNGWELAYNNNGVVWFGGREDASTYILVTASLLVKQINMGITANGGWYNAVGIKSGNQWSISVTETNSYRHIDNIAKIYKGITKHLPGYRTIQAGTGTIPFGTNTLTVGKASNSNDYYMNGRLMNLSIYNRALSLAEINQNYDSFNKRIIEIAGVPLLLLLLDFYTNASVAYSLRRVRAAYTGYAIKVRRSSDSQELDIGFNGSGDLDTAALLAFVGSGDGFVTRWYDQSGNNDYAYNNTPSTQPRVVISGVVVTNGTRPAIYWDNSRPDVLIINTKVWSGVNAIRSSFVNMEWVTGSGNTPIFGQTTDAAYHADTTGANLILSAVYSYVDIRNGALYLNGVLKTLNQFSKNIDTNQLISIIQLSQTGYLNLLGNDRGYAAPAGYFKGYYSEIIIYPDDQTANRVAIESNINQYYSLW